MKYMALYVAILVIIFSIMAGVYIADTNPARVRADVPTGQTWAQVGRGYWQLMDYDFGVVCYTASFPATDIACVKVR